MKNQTQYKNLKRDPNSGGIVNDDPLAFKKYKKQREVALLKIKREKLLEERIDSNESDINSIKSDVSEIKNLLNNLIIKLT